MALQEIIIQRIAKEGAISFHDFMEMCLYYPGLGYYTSEKEKFGQKGDYYTSPILSTLYGQMIGTQLEEMWQIMDRQPFVIVEYGAGTGALSFDILNYLKKKNSFYEYLKYVIIEKSSELKKVQQRLLPEKVEWLDDIEEITGFRGCVVSNEVVDNFSVHLVEMHEILMEVFVNFNNGFTEEFRPASQELQNYFQKQNIVLPTGYRTEVNLEALEWLRDISVHMVKGYTITIDYGYTSSEYYSEKRNLGTLACYYQHTVTDRLYSNIGRQDITAHVNFSALAVWGKKYGLDFTGYCNQNYFLRSLGLASFLRKLELENAADKGKLIQVNKLLFDMGDKFKVLIQRKGIDKNLLTGMQFSQHSLS